MANTPRFGIAELSHGELNGDVTFNEALRLLEMLTQPVIEELNAANPPGTPVHGKLYTVGTPANWPVSPVDGTPVLYDLAQYYDGAWYYFTPFEGMRLYDLDTSTDYQFNGTVWA